MPPRRDACESMPSGRSKRGNGDCPKNDDRFARSEVCPAPTRLPSSDLMPREIPNKSSTGESFALRIGTLPGLETSTSLLRMLGDGDALAWSSFGRRYAIFLLKWSDRAGIPKQDAEDLVQETFIKILDQIHKFHRRGIGSFRSWIKAIAWHCWCDAIRRSKRRDVLLQLEPFRKAWLTSEGLEAGLESLIRQEMLETAINNVRNQVSPRAWGIYQWMTSDGLSGPEVAKRLNMSPGAVYTTKCRVQQSITSELRKLEEGQLE